MLKAKSTLLLNVCAELNTKLFWSVTVATVTVPEIPVPVTTMPCTIVPTFVSTTNAVVLDIAPFTFAVALA